MKKYILAFVAIGLSLWISAQERNPAAMRSSFEKMDIVFSQFKDLSSFKEMGQEAISDKVIAEYRGLFDASADVYSGISLRRDSLGFFSLPLQATSQKIDPSLADIKLNFPAGIRMAVTKSNIDYSHMATGEAKIILERTMSGKTKAMSATGLKDYFIQSTDTVEVVFGLNQTDMSVKILGVKKIGAQINCPDCLKDAQEELKRRDKLAAKDRKDLASDDVKKVKPPKEEKQPKPIKPPKPPKEAKPERDSNPIAFDIALQPYLGPGLISISLNELTKGSLDTDVYTNLIRSKSEVSGFTTSGMRSSFAAGANGEILFGKKTQFGVSIGLMYQTSRSELKLEDYHVEYASVDAAGISYNRIVEGKDIEEKIKVKSTTMPLLFRLSLGKGEKIHWHFGVGPVLSVKTKVTSSATALGNFEAVYHRSNDQFVFDPTGNIDSEDWLLTYDAVSARTGQTGADQYFQNHLAAGYDIAHNKSFSETEKAYAFNMKSAFLVSASAGLNLGKRSELTLGIQFVSSSFDREGDARYAMFSSTTDDYVSLMEASSKMKTTSFNVLAGIRFLLTEKNQ